MAAAAEPLKAPDRSWRGDLPALGVILLIGLALRAAYLRELVHTPDFAAPLADAAYHDYWARALVAGDWTPPPDTPDPQIYRGAFARPPGYPYFLAAVYAVSGGSYLAPRLVQAALGLVSVVLAWGLTRTMLGRGAALATGLLAAVFWGFIYYEGELQEPALLVPLILGLVWVLARWAAQPAAWRLLVAGVLIGAGALLRPNVLLLGVIAGLWLTGVLWRRSAVRRWPAAVGLLVLGTLLPIAPVTVRNWRVSGDFVLISTNGAINLWVGNNELADGYTARLPDLPTLSGQTTWSWFTYPDIVRGIEQQAGRSLRPSEVAAWLRAKAWQFIRERPGRAAELAARRVGLLLGPAIVANNKEVHCERQASAVLRWLPGWPLALSGAVLGLVMMWVAGRRRHLARAAASPRANESRAERAEKEGAPGVSGQGEQDGAPGWLMGLFVFAWLGSFVPFLAAERFRVPVAGLLLIPAGLALARLAEWAVCSKRQAIGWGLAGVGLYALAQVPLVKYEPQPAAWHMGRGDAYVRRGALDAAAVEYGKALELKPTYVQARQALADVLRRLGRSDEASQAAAELAQLSPDDPIALNTQARALIEQGRLGEAEAVLTRTQSLAPGYAPTYVSLGTLYAEQQRADEALAAYRRALELDPRSAEAHYNLGLLLLARGAKDEALAAFGAAIAANGQFVEARLNYAKLAGERRDVDGALEQYRRVYELAPNRFEGRVGLAATLATKGQLAEALEHAEAAVRLRPGDPQAVGLREAIRKAGGR